MSAANNPQESVRLMSHLLAAQQCWLGRLNGISAETKNLWPDDLSADSLEQITNDNNKAWIACLSTLNDADFDKKIAYKNSTGTAFNDKLSDIMAHLINHGTHHRAQIGQQLKSAEYVLPVTDYIAYIRGL